MELWDLYNLDREKTGVTMSRGEKQPDGTYRIVVHICVFNDKGEMLVQHRQPFKSGWPNLWDLSAGGCSVSGENSRRAAERELFEELGIKMSFESSDPILSVHFGKVFDDYYVVKRNLDFSELTLQKEEVQGVAWASLDEIKSMIERGEFVPYHKCFIDLLFTMRDHRGAILD